MIFLKYALIGYNNPTHKRGAYTEAKCLADKYPTILSAFDAGNNINMNDIRHKFDTVVFTYQNPNKLNECKVLDLKYYNTDIIYIRKNIISIFKNKTTNGFSMYLDNPFYVNFVPMCINMLESKTVDTSKIILGYYIRPQYRPDDFAMFIKFIKDIKYDIELYVMGSFIFDFKSLNKHIKKLIYTTDNVLFFDNVTHYVYSESWSFDPWPTTLQEAVNSNKQIIILEQYRNFKDGITDIKECIDYHADLNLDLYYDNSKCILNTWNWNNYYPNVFNNNFKYVFDRNKIKHFTEWLELW